MTPAAWFTLAVLSPLFAGFLYLPYRQAREGGALRPHSAGGWLALSALLALYVLMTSVAWANPFTAWVQLGASGAANRMLPAAWAVFSLPAWAASIIVFPNVARDLWASCSALPTASPRAFAALGWVLLGSAWAVFGVLVLMHNG